MKKTKQNIEFNEKAELIAEEQDEENQEIVKMVMHGSILESKLQFPLDISNEEVIAVRVVVGSKFTYAL